MVLILLKPQPLKLALIQLLAAAKWIKTVKSPLLTELGIRVHQNTMICQMNEWQQHALYTSASGCFFLSVGCSFIQHLCSLISVLWKMLSDSVPWFSLYMLASKETRRKGKKRSVGCGLLLRINIKDVKGTKARAAALIQHSRLGSCRVILYNVYATVG